MAEVILDEIEETNKKRGKRVSYILHGIILLLLFMPFFSFPDPPPGMAGVLVNLGMPDQGQGTDNAPPPKAAAPARQPQKTTPPPPTPPKTEPVKPKPKAKPKTKPVKEKPATKEVVTADNNEIAIKREKERKEKERQRQEELEKRQEELEKKREEEREEAEERERERQEKVDADRKQRAEEEAKRKAAAEAARKKAEAEAKAKAAAEAKRKAEADARAEADGLFGGGGSGKGDKNKPGNGGNPDGDPSGDALEGISSGAGGGQVSGFGGRGVLNAPKVTDNTQKTGRVVIKVCVNASGKVTSAEFTQRGSTTTDSQLRATAIRNAKKFKFAAGSADKECGTITYEFKLR